MISRPDANYLDPHIVVLFSPDIELLKLSSQVKTAMNIALSLPTEVLLSICEQTQSCPIPRANGVGSRLDVSGRCLLDIKAFASASKRFREVAAPLLFKHVCMRTREQVVALVRSRLLVNIRHVHFPSINILTSRRPLGSHLHTLIRQATSVRLASSDPAFYTDIPRYLCSLLPVFQHLTEVEVYYGDGVNLPYVDPISVFAEFIASLRGVKMLSARLPGGRPSFKGVERLINRITAPTSPLANLQHLFLSHQLPLQLALSPEDLALSLARRLPNLQLVTMATPKKGMSTDISIWSLGGPGGLQTGWGMSGGELKVWKVRRRLGCGEEEDQEVVYVDEVDE
ncbi:F-box-like protein [Ceratobasidium sp. AG-Ba]|nr:F-box-like protein [Ceratobasidium sp. AG-Ba]